MRPLERTYMRNAGFTLIELLVALVLISLIFLLITSALQFGSNAWSTRNEEPSDSSEVLPVQSLLSHIFSEIRPVMVEADAVHARHVFFFGSENSIRFIAPVPKHLGVGGFYEVTIDKNEDSPSSVELSWRLFRTTVAASGPAIQDRHVALISRVSKLQFAYFGYRGKNEPAQWYNDWQDSDHLPDLIRMRVAMSGSDRSWPDLVVAPMVRSLNLIIDPEHIDQ